MRDDDEGRLAREYIGADAYFDWMRLDVWLADTHICRAFSIYIGMMEIGMRTRGRGDTRSFRGRLCVCARVMDSWEFALFFYMRARELMLKVPSAYIL